MQFDPTMLVTLAALALGVAHHRLQQRPPPLPPANSLRKQLLFFGDSIVGDAWSGWLASLAALYKRTADVTNRGFNGYNSRWAMQVLPHLPAADLVGVCLGANDAIRPAPLRGRETASSRHHVPLDEYEANLRAIIAHFRARGARVLVMTPPPTDGQAWMDFERRTKPAELPEGAESTRSNTVTGEYAARAVSAAQGTAGVAVVDLWSEMQRAELHGGATWPSLFSDGVHPNAAGAEVIYELVRTAIAKHFPELKPAGVEGGMLFDFPSHGAIDGVDPARSFREWAHRREEQLGMQPANFR